MPNTSLDITADELCAIIEATHDALMSRLGWTTNWQDGPWRNLPFTVAQQSLDLLVSALAKELMLLRDIDDNIHPEFEEMFSVPEEAMDIINAITLAEDWRDVPRHGHHMNCKVCALIST